ncbi:TetR/AcrR family transcriptional regulator C-terminal domain-containing protein [Spirillospora sp. NPDC050679]
MTGAAAPMPTPPGRRPRRSAPPRRRLTADLIVTTALAVLDAEGLDAVSMRRVAQELGTGPASLYAHVANKDELLELMLDRVAGEVPLPEPDPGRWQEQLKEIAHASHRVWTAHRDIARACLGLIPTGANMLRIADAQLGAMRAGGVPPRIAALAVDALGMFVNSSAIEDTAYQARAAEEDDPQEYYERYIGQVREYFGSLPADRFPHIVATAEELTSGSGEERFAFGLDVLVRGIASHAVPPGAG